MNQAHYHLVVNHLPIVGLLIGTITLIISILLKKSQVKLTALAILIFSALSSIAAFYTGEGAEEIAEEISTVSETIIHQHEENAELFCTLILIVGGLSVISFIAELKKSKYSHYLILIVLALAISSGYLAINTANSGGEIRHTEIRTNTNLPQQEEYDEDN